MTSQQPDREREGPREHRSRTGWAALALALAAVVPGTAAAGTPIPVVLDTDIGESIDDSVALALAVASPEIELRGVTTTGEDSWTRAVLVCRFLDSVGRAEVPVAAAGRRAGAPRLDGQFQYGLRAAHKQPLEVDAVELLRREVDRRPGELTILAVGPLTTVAQLLARHPECRERIARVVIMGGAIRVGYENAPPPEPEYNVRSDVASARAVLASGVPLKVAPLDATAGLTLAGAARERVLSAPTTLSHHLRALVELWGGDAITLFDPVAVALVFDDRFFELEELRLAIDDDGSTRVADDGRGAAIVATSIDREAYLGWLADRLSTAGEPSVIDPNTTNLSSPVPRGRFPSRVHVVEDYETDIERRWWLAGALETGNVPPGSRRACRAVVCRNFDRRMGEPWAAYRAVIFNPVPGPPMGPATRLGFRYFLRGDDRLKVQIYSLSNGYHRHLTLTGLEQGRWIELTVDMTAARRPDGSGGPLSADERIDDIQFYARPDAELIIDDIVLYDAGAGDAVEPFPRRVLFAGWFDTGRQGVEWPGDFEIVPNEAPRTWKSARSVPREDNDTSWVRVDLRGERPRGDVTDLRFRYRLSGPAGALQVTIAGDGAEETATLVGLARDAWAEASARFRGGPRRVRELRFVVPTGATLLVDDVLLYERESPAPPERPNIVLIMADDLGYGELGCYGQTKIRTPSIDRLAAEGMRFTQCYSGSHVCAPSRSVLMTGLHTGHTPIRANGGGMFLHDDDVTVAEVLRGAGYATGCFGKWGLGVEGTPGHPNRQGFDEFFGFLHQVHAHFYYPYYLRENETTYPLPENEGRRRGRYSHDVIHERVLEFIRENRERPFFCYVPYTIPHVELVVPDDSRKPYEGLWDETPLPDPRPGYIGAEKPYATFAGMVSRMDRDVGEILDLLDRLGIERRTVVLFTSDNGAQGGAWARMTDFFEGNGGLRGYKGSFFEGGIRVPLLVRWPGRVAPGSVSDHVCAFQDVLPTTADIAGARPPEGIDGISFLPTLLGEGTPRRHEHLYWEHPRGGGFEVAVRMGKWKYLRPRPRAPAVLFDLSADGGETTDVASRHPDVVETIEALLPGARTPPRTYPREVRRPGVSDFVR